MKCKYCGNEFQPIREGQKFCSPHHRIEWHRLHNASEFQRGWNKGFKSGADALAERLFKRCMDDPQNCMDVDCPFMGRPCKILCYTEELKGDME